MRMKLHQLGYQTKDGKFPVYRLYLGENGEVFNGGPRWNWRSMDGHERSFYNCCYKKECIEDLEMYLEMGSDEYQKYWTKTTF